MPTHPLVQAVESLKSSGIVRTKRGATEKEIREAEAALGVRFPGLYRLLLRKYGVIDIYDSSVFGAGVWARRNAGGRSVVFHTQYARDAISLPPKYIVLWHESHPDVWCLDTSSSSERCPVWHLDPEKSVGGRMKPVRVAASLIAWLREIVAKKAEFRERIDREMPGVFTPTGEIRSPQAKKKYLARMRARASRSTANARGPKTRKKR